MAPTLDAGDWLLVDPDAYSRRGPRSGELVLVRDPRQADRLLVKRVGAVSSDGLVEVVGDAPWASTDSRVFGPVDRGRHSPAGRSSATGRLDAPAASAEPELARQLAEQATCSRSRGRNYLVEQALHAGLPVGRDAGRGQVGRAEDPAVATCVEPGLPIGRAFAEDRHLGVETPREVRVVAPDERAGHDRAGDAGRVAPDLRAGLVEVRDDRPDLVGGGRADVVLVRVGRRRGAASVACRCHRG